MSLEKNGAQSYVLPAVISGNTTGSLNCDRYLSERPLPFYPWLRGIAWSRLCDLHERHVNAQKRSIGREARASLMLSDQSMVDLLGRIEGRGSSPSRQLVRQERRQRVRHALEQLNDRDREVLVLRFLEELSMREVASIIGVNEGAVPIQLVNIVHKATARNPMDRYQTAQQMADDLRRYTNREPILARQPSLWHKTVKWSQRHGVVLAWVVVILCMAIGLLAFAVPLNSPRKESGILCCQRE